MLLVFSGYGHADAKPDAQAPLLVKYAKIGTGDYVFREKYLEELLMLAMNKSGQPFKLQPVSINPLNDKRGISYLHTGYYTVHWLNTSAELEEELLPIRIPLFKGLIGWRILVVRKEDQAQFSTIDSLDKLKPYKVLLGDDWSDTPVFIANGFEVVTSSILTLPKMLARKRGDIYPRSLIEVWHEMEVKKQAGLHVEENLILRYPAAYYFFVTKSNVDLQKALEKGLNESVKDGSFDEVFYRHFRETISMAKLEKRNILELSNPYMSEQTPFQRKELWY